MRISNKKYLMIFPIEINDEEFKFSWKYIHEEYGGC